MHYVQDMTVDDDDDDRHGDDKLEDVCTYDPRVLIYLLTNDNAFHFCITALRL